MAQGILLHGNAPFASDSLESKLTQSIMRLSNGW